MKSIAVTCRLISHVEPRSKVRSYTAGAKNHDIKKHKKNIVLILKRYEHVFSNFMEIIKIREGSRLLFGVAQIVFVNRKGSNCLRIFINNINFHELNVLTT